MKRFFAVTLALMLMFGSLGLTAFATATETTDVFVTISDATGKLVLTQEKITVTDIDNDNTLTINDALYIAHEEKYQGGATEGYESSNSAYGLSLNKLWGVANGGSYGYYVNNSSAMSLSDTINNGDYINAFVYTDLTSWSDTYCYFDVKTAQVNQNEKISFTLLSAGYDEQWNPISVPVKDAIITLNGEKTEILTDTEGKATITIENSGAFVISAVSDTQILVPPVCIANVLPVEEATEDITTLPTEAVTTVPTEVTTTSIPTGTTTPTEESTTASSSDDVKVPNTGDNNSVIIITLLLGFSLVVVSTVKVKNSYEK